MRDSSGTTKDLAIDFIVYGALAEIFARDTGVNRGFGGSMHAFFPPFGVYPNNAIVGGSADISVGAALFKHVNKRRGIVIANIGDASMGCGPVWEAMMFAAMDQYRTLWDKELGGAPPILFNFMNNFYGMGGQPVGETMGFQILARVGLGVNPDAMQAERVDGYHPLAVADAIERKKKLLEAGQGPVLLDTVTYRYSGHSPSDASSYREKSEVDAWREIDPIAMFGDELMNVGISTADELDRLRQEARDAVFRAYSAARDSQLAPRADLSHAGCLLDQAMFSNTRVPAASNATVEVQLPLNENPRVQQLKSRSRSAFATSARRP